MRAEERAQHTLGQELCASQVRVLDLLAEGLQNKVIAHRLGLTEGTVKSHVSGMIKRSGRKNRVQLAVWWALRKAEEKADG